jgi:predicted secreted protein
MESNSVITIEANIGETFVLNLDEKPSTGYIWKPIFDNKYLKLISEDYYTNSSMPGSSSIHEFLFKGLEKGEHNLKIVYQRDWEKTPAKQISYLVKIN